jgi:hypothetical protein
MPRGRAKHGQWPAQNNANNELYLVGRQLFVVGRLQGIELSQCPDESGHYQRQDETKR